MRICVNVDIDATPRIIEEDVEIALNKLGYATENADIVEQDTGSFTVDWEGRAYANAGEIAQQIKDDTGAVVHVDVIPEWPA